MKKFIFLLISSIILTAKNEIHGASKELTLGWRYSSGILAISLFSWAIYDLYKLFNQKQINSGKKIRTYFFLILSFLLSISFLLMALNKYPILKNQVNQKNSQ